MRIKINIHGKLASKSNSRRFVGGRGTQKPRLIKSKKAMQFESEAQWQIPAQYKILGQKGFGSREHPVGMNIKLVYQNYMNDADPSLLFDVLERAGVISNDRWIRYYIIDAQEIDKEDPRVEVEIYSLKDKEKHAA